MKTPDADGAPRILLVEDDPVSQAFLVAALAALPAQVDAAGSCAQALALAAKGHDLWLVDAQLPDGNGAALLTRLRSGGAGTPALAHTASRQPNDHDALLAAGFARVLVKPIGTQALHAAIRAMLGLAIGTAVADTGDRIDACPDWDDAAALQALNGQQAQVASLRALFLDELPGQRAAVVAACGRGDGETVRAILHRLRASCGFVGAARLAAAVRHLADAVDDAAALARFDAAVGALLDRERPAIEVSGEAR